MLETRSRTTLRTNYRTGMIRSGASLLASAVATMIVHALSGPSPAYWAMWVLIFHESWRFTRATSIYSRVIDLD